MLILKQVFGYVHRDRSEEGGLQEVLWAVFGVHEDTTSRTTIAELMRFHSSKSGKEQISLKEYVNRMKEGQQDIYYFTVKALPQYIIPH